MAPMGRRAQRRVAANLRRVRSAASTMQHVTAVRSAVRWPVFSTSSPRGAGAQPARGRRDGGAGGALGRSALLWGIRHQYRFLWGAVSRGPGARAVRRCALHQYLQPSLCYFFAACLRIPCFY